MWFSFPQGTTALSCNQQQFVPEHTADGVNYFRAPSHFAPIILDLPGFKITRYRNRHLQ